MLANVLYCICFLVAIIAVDMALAMLFPPDRSWSFRVRFRYAIVSLFDALYCTPRRRWIEWRCKRARKYLIAHDFDFRTQAAGNELVRRRQEFYNSGGKPDSAECPDIHDVLQDWGYSPPNFRR